MKYRDVCEAKFIVRKNRFVAEAELPSGEIVTVHVKNTGRCKELLLPGCVVYLEHTVGEKRKTLYDLVAVLKKCDDTEILFNIDSSAPNKAVEEWLPGGLFPSGARVRREVTFGNSRFDFYVESGDKKAYLEVKGVTLEEGGRLYFPDAPTERGVKHLKELCKCVKCGYEAYVLFVIQMKGAESFSPNVKTHPEFAEALRDAELAGVKILAVDCDVTPSEMKIRDFVKVELI